MLGNPPGYIDSQEVCKRAGIARPSLIDIIRRDEGFPEPYLCAGVAYLHREELIEQWLSTYRKFARASKDQETVQPSA